MEVGPERAILSEQAVEEAPPSAKSSLKCLTQQHVAWCSLMLMSLGCSSKTSGSTK